MVERKEGLIVNIGLIAGNLPTPWNGIYCASKAAAHALSDALAIECKPFGVKVILVAPGAVQSNISTKQAATLKLSTTSIYKPYFDRVHEHLYFGRGKGCMATDEFARRVVAKVLSPNPPTYMSLGGNSRLAAFCHWLPHWLFLWIMGLKTVWRNT
ncbi:hypothetical protein BDR07DRAFT_1487566 [Suillus spraguei]|nr:hypothetical protein BDR07DRAFT_1487566 [Suillus spraguei]